MNTAAQYAKALHELGSDPKHLPVLREALRKRGHEKLLPRILSEYQKQALAQDRLQMHKEVTPEKERTRMLLELYRKLTHITHV